MPEVIGSLDRYARAIAAPVQTAHPRRPRCARPMPAISCAPTAATGMRRTVVLASGACNVPCVPRLAAALPPSVQTLTPMAYRNPDQLAPGGVLVVGASATGIQLADEIHRSGRPVTLAVGEHIRAPRTYRGRDIQWWMDRRRRPRPALRRGRRPRARPQSPLAPARRLARARDARPQCAARASASAWSAGSPGSATAASSSRARSPTNARSPTSSWAACSTRSTAGRPSTASTAGSAHRSRFPPTEVDVAPPPQPRPRAERHPDDPLGDRLPPGLSLARGPGARPQGPDPPRRRGRHRRPASTSWACRSCAAASPR